MENAHEALQVVSYHPGLLWNEYFETLGLPREKFDSGTFMLSILILGHVSADTLALLRIGELAGAFAVWAATKEAAFLHGRFVWASWDVEELATGETRRQIDEDPYFLRSTIAPLKRGAWA